MARLAEFGSGNEEELISMTDQNFDHNPDSGLEKHPPQGAGRNYATQHSNQEQQRLERLSQDVHDLRQTSEANARNHRFEVNRLQNRLGFMTGLSLVVIASLVGAIAWLGVSLKFEQNQLTEQVRSLDGEKNRLEQIQSLENQLKALSQKVPGTEAFTRELNANQARIQDLEARIRQISENSQARQQVIDRLEKILQRLTPQSGYTSAESGSSTGSN